MDYLLTFLATYVVDLAGFIFLYWMLFTGFESKFEKNHKRNILAFSIIYFIVLNISLIIGSLAGVHKMMGIPFVLSIVISYLYIHRFLSLIRLFIAFIVPMILTIVVVLISTNEGVLALILSFAILNAIYAILMEIFNRRSMTSSYVFRSGGLYVLSVIIHTVFSSLSNMLDTDSVFVYMSAIFALIVLVFLGLIIGLIAGRILYFLNNTGFKYYKLEE